MVRAVLALLCFLLLANPAVAAGGARVWIAEFSTSRIEAAAPMAVLPSAVKQTPLDLSGGTAKTSAVFGANTKYIRIMCEAQCAISGKGVATANDVVLPPLRPEYFFVSGIKTISVIAAP